MNDESKPSPDEAGRSIERSLRAVKPAASLRPVLLVSYYFPPSGGPGVQRVLKFTRYLPEFGFRPIVLTVPEDAEFPVLDPSLLRDVPPEAVVVRSPIVEFYHWYRTLAGDRARRTALDLHTVSPRAGRTWRDRILSRIRGALFIPDGRVGWFPGAVRAGLRICRAERPVAIFASGPPFTTHWIGRRLSERTGIPLVVDYRDPWTNAPFYPERPHFARRADERLERSCLERAQAIVTVNRTMQEDLLARHPKLEPAKFHYIPNGFDGADFEGLVRSRAQRWTLVHTGSLQASRTPGALLDALRQWYREEDGLAEEVRIRFLGRLDAQLETTLREPPVSCLIELEGYRPHLESVQALVDADLLLLLIVDDPQARGMLTGKLFEYLGSGTPILALAPPGEAADVIRHTGAGRVVSPHDSVGIGDALREARHDFRCGRPAFGMRPSKLREQYSRFELTRQLASILDRIRS